MNIRFFENKKYGVFVLFLIAVVASVLTSFDGGDFDVFLFAAKRLREGQNMYAYHYIDGLPYYYSVFFAMLLTPFSENFFLAELLWSLLSFFLLFRTYKLIETFLDISVFSEKQYKLWLFLSVFFSLQFVLYNISLIQVTIFLLWAILESLNLLFKEKYILCGLLLGLAINIKVMPILLFSYLIYRGYFMVVFICISTIVILLFLPAIFIGNDFNQTLLSSWWQTIDPSNSTNGTVSDLGIHSIEALIPAYLTETVGQLSYKRNIFNLSSGNIAIIINLSRILILSLSLFFLRSLPFKKQQTRLNFYWETSFFIMIIPLLLPRQHKYAFLLVTPMLCYLFYFFILTFNGNKTRIYKFLLCIFSICLFFYSPLYGSSIIGWFLFLFTQHYKFLTFATLLIIPIAVYCNPERLELLKTQEPRKL